MMWAFGAVTIAPVVGVGGMLYNPFPVGGIQRPELSRQIVNGKVVGVAMPDDAPAERGGSKQHERGGQQSVSQFFSKYYRSCNRDARTRRTESNAPGN